MRNRLAASSLSEVSAGSVFVMLLLVSGLAFLAAALYKNAVMLIRSWRQARECSRRTGESFWLCFRHMQWVNKHGMGPLELRCRELSLSPEGLPRYALEVRGSFPVRTAVRATFVTSIFDVSGTAILEKDLVHRPVECTDAEFREPDTRAFQARCQAGEVKPQFGYTWWTQIAEVMPSTLLPSESGPRTLRFVARLLNAVDPPAIRRGFIAPAQFNPEHVLWQGAANLNWQFPDEGWRSPEQRNADAERLAVVTVLRIALAIAVREGALDAGRQAAVKYWIARRTAPLTGDAREAMTTELEAVMKEYTTFPSARCTDPVESARRLCELRIRPAHTDCLELVHAVLAAGPRSDSGAAALIGQIARTLEVDAVKLERIADASLLGAAVQRDGEPDVDAILGIDASAGKDDILRYLRREFQKWNNRLATLTLDSEREAAQHRLHLISLARERHASGT